MVGYAANTVGQEGGSTKFNIRLSQFTNADGSETNLKISSLFCNQVYDENTGFATGFQPGGDTVQLFTSDGRLDKVYSYATAEYIAAQFAEGEPGWYDYSDVTLGDFSKPMGDVSVKFGEGYIIKAGDGGGVLPSVTCSGAVKNGVTEIPGKPFAFAGNCTPIGITLADILCNQVYDENSGAATGFQPGGDTLQFFTTDGRLDKVYSYATAEYIAAQFAEGEPGWYDYSEVTLGDFSKPCNVTPLSAGEAFIYKTGDGAGVWPTITINKNPLAAAE